MAQARYWGWSGTDYSIYGVNSTPGGFSTFGGNLPGAVQDSNDATYARWNGSGIFGFAINDPNIPSASTGVQAGVSSRSGSNIPSSDQYYLAKSRSAIVKIGNLTGGAGPNNDSATSSTDGDGGTLTPGNFAATYWGVYADGFTTYLMKVFELQVYYTFTLPTPGAITNQPSGVSTSAATLNASVNPNTATSAYPVTYLFEWGITPAFGNTTTPGTLTGNGSTGVTANISGLAAGNTYYYRIKAYNADVTSFGDTVSFTAGSGVVSGRRQFASL
jgi:hypothetical protein